MTIRVQTPMTLSRRLIRPVAIFAGGAAYWQLVSLGAGTGEPWDAGAYWTLWYPGSLALAALAGWASRGQGWVAGLLLTIAQLPVLWLNSGIGPYWLVGISLLGVLALPAAGVGWLADRIAQRTRR